MYWCLHFTSPQITLGVFRILDIEEQIISIQNYIFGGGGGKLWYIGYKNQTKTDIKTRHNVIYVDKLTYCIQGTYFLIRWWSVMWHNSQSLLELFE